MGTSLASIFGIWCYRTYLQDVPVKVTLRWTAIASAVLGEAYLKDIWRRGTHSGQRTRGVAAGSCNR